MKKNFVQDVVPPKKSIRNVTLSSRPSVSIKKPEPEPVVSKHREEDDDFTRPVMIKQAPTPPVRMDVAPPVRPPIDIPSYKYEYDEPKKPSKKWFYVGITVLVLAIAFGVSAFFKSATIRVTPKEDSQNLSDSFRAIKDTTGATLGFQIVTISKSVEKNVTATGEQQVEKKASGKIIIYNENSAAQKLIATTRFETPEGLVFRLPTAVTVPAKQTVNGKAVAGSAEVAVEADKTGTAYNIGLKDFTLPGLKGDAKYTTVYARSKTEMTGGFSGMQKVVAKDVLDTAETELTSELKDSLAKDITTQIPANFVLYTASLSYKLDAVDQVSNTTGGATLRKKGTTSAVIFDKSALSKAILAKVAPSVPSDTVRITNLETLNFTFATGTAFDAVNDVQLNFTLNGPVNFVYIFDENKLKTDLLGLSRAKAKVVLASYDMIQEAWVETHPFWNQTVPKDSTKVSLINTLSQ